MEIRKINFLRGKVTYSEFNIDFSLPLTEQLFNLQEDLLQVEYGENYLLDVGWYPMLEAVGHLCIKIVRDYDWENPIFEKKIPAKDLQSFPHYLEEAIELADKLNSEL